MSNIPTVSVIMPVYNARRFLGKAIESILDQTFGDFEFIIIDDGSSDSSLRLMQKYAKKDSRVHILAEPHAGLLVCLNKGIEVARGELIARMDSDDIAMPARFEQQVAYLNEHPECAVLGTQVLLIDADGFPLDRWSLPLEHEEIVSTFLEGKGGIIPHPSSMMRKSIVEEAGRYDPEFLYVEDFELFLRMSELGRLANLPETLLQYRLHPSSVCESRGNLQRTLKQRAIEEYCQRRDVPAPQLPAYTPVGLQPSNTHYLKNAKRAFRAGFPRTARRNAVKSLMRRPTCRQSWKLLLSTSPAWLQRLSHRVFQIFGKAEPSD